jgi:peptidoglycan hydrolase-like protein with peptidoglycan-binding domain
MLRERNRSLVRSFATPLVLDDVVSHPLNDILEKGDAGSAVSALQKLLTDLKFNITVDGIFGKQTEDAIRQFQKKHVLDVTGIVTPQVYGAIEEEASSPKVPVKKLTTGSFLHKGDAGSSVLVLQKALNKKGAVPTVAENGIFDAATVTAVKSFQKKNHLDVDGVVGPKTFAGLGVS